MKIKLYLSLALGALFMASCSSDREQPVGTGGEVTGEETKTVASTTIRTTSASTRAVTFPGTAPTDDEKMVNNVAVFVFNKQKMLEQVVIPTDQVYTNGETEIPVEFETTTGLHYLYGFLNIPTTDFNTLTSLSGISMDEFVAKLLTYSAIDPLIGEGAGSEGFMMTNTKDPVTANFVETTDPLDNEIVIPVGRAVAKVSLAFDPGVQQDGILTNVEYKVVNNPNRLYLLPKYSSNVLWSPHYEDATVNTANFMANPAHDYQFAITPSTQQADWTWTYCMENANKVAKEGNTTMAILKGKFTPEFLMDAKGEPSKLDASGTFWRIAKVTPAGSIIYFQPGYFSEQPASTLLESDELAFEYENGLTYYPIWLTSTDTDNKYSVKRNSYYKITVTAVSGAGYPDDEGEDGVVIEPETPLEGQAMVKSIIEIIDWSEMDQEAHI